MDQNEKKTVYKTMSNIRRKKVKSQIFNFKPTMHLKYTYDFEFYTRFDFIYEKIKLL